LKKIRHQTQYYLFSLKNSSKDDSEALSMIPIHKKSIYKCESKNIENGKNDVETSGSQHKKEAKFKRTI